MTSNEEPTIIIINLGSPQKCSWISVAKFLREFLMDPFVIAIPYLYRLLLVYFVIIPFRTIKTLQRYRVIWNKDKKISPLIERTRMLSQNLKQKLRLDVHCAMRYQSPSVKSIGKQLRKDKKRNIYVFFMFPHYAMSSFQTAQKHVQKVFKKVHPTATVKYLPPYAHKPFYVKSLATLIKRYLTQDKRYLLFSYHGVPERQLSKINNQCLMDKSCCENFDSQNERHQYCYKAQIMATSRLVANAIGLQQDEYSVCFQSRLGKTKWIEPYTDQVLKELALKGVTDIYIVSPSFLVDCLETLEEVQIEFKNIFLAAGGKKFTYIPCLNNEVNWIANLSYYLQNAIK